MAPMQTCRLVFGILGNITSISLALAPMPTFWKIWQRKSVEQFSGIPYATALLYSLFWAWYALPFVTKDNLLLFTTSSAEALLELAYLTLYICFAQKKHKVQVFTSILVLVLVFGCCAGITFLLGHSQRKLFVGLITTVVSIGMYISPLVALKEVIATKSVEYMPFLLSFAIFISCIIWTIFGFLGSDIYVMVISDGSGSILGAVQLLLYAIYRNSKSKKVGEVIESPSSTSPHKLEKLEEGYEHVKSNVDA